MQRVSHRLALLHLCVCVSLRCVASCREAVLNLGLFPPFFSGDCRDPNSPHTVVVLYAHSPMSRNHPLHHHAIPLLFLPSMVNRVNSM